MFELATAHGGFDVELVDLRDAGSWSPLAGGLLSGRFDPEKKGPADARRASFDFPPVDSARLPRVLAALRQVAEETHTSVARIALAWQLTKPFVTRIIIGAKRLEQLEDNLAAVDVALSPEQVKALDDASALPAEYPGWMVDWQNKDVRGAATGMTAAERARTQAVKE
ncbi:MAG: aldo/keto reductase [Polyangiaceae bacterium]